MLEPGSRPRRSATAIDIRIGLDASNLRSGGGLTFLIETLAAVELRDVEEVIVWAGARTIERLPRRERVRLIHERLLDGNLPARVLWQQLRLPSLARAARCDVLFSPGGTAPLLFAPTVVFSKNMLPFEATERRRYGWSWMRWKMELLRLAQGRSFARAAGVLFLSEYAQREIGDAIGRLERTSIVPNGVGDGFFRPPRPQCDVKGRFEFLYVSTISPYKHHINVASALARLRGEGWPVVGRFIGPNDPGHPRSLPQLLRHLRTLDPPHEFLFHEEAVPYGEIASRYHAADGYVFASSCENQPIALLEAMAAGLPIASSDRGPMPEVLGDCGLYFDPENIDSIVGALRLLLESPQRRAELAARAYERARPFTWQRCAADTFAFVSAIARQNRDRGSTP